MVSTRQLLATITAALPTTLAQTKTCDPLTESACPPNTALSSSKFSSDWTGSDSLSSWTTTAGSIGFGSNGAEFVINERGDAPTIQSDFYVFFGKVEVKMQAAAGTGIVSSIVLMSDVNDEIDWEFTGGDTTQTQTNYFGKGNTTTYDRAIWYPVDSPQTSSHTYTVDWTPDALTWYIDGTPVRSLSYADANGGSNYPQTPCRIKLGIWAGGDPDNEEGTIEWAGGETDFSQSPFTMFVQSVAITNSRPASEYKYTDQTGDMDSIELVGGSGSGSGGSPSSTSASSSTESAKSDSRNAGTTKTSSTPTSIPTTITSSVATNAPPTVPLAQETVSTSGSSRSSASTTESDSSAATSSGTVSPSSTTLDSDEPDSAATRSGGNALGALALFVLAAMFAF